MYSVVFAVLLLASSLEAKGVNTLKAETKSMKSNDSIEMIERSSKLVVSTEMNQAAMTGLEFVAFIMDGTGYLGSGVVVNKFWVVTLTSVVTGKTATDLDVVAGAVDPLFDATVGVWRGGKAIVEKAAACGAALLDCIALVRVCPSFADTQFAVPLATDITVFRDPTLDVNLFTYKTAVDTAVATNPLNSLVKKIGERCECMDNVLYIMDSHVCVAEHPTNYGEVADETKGVIVTSADKTQIIGFLVKAQDPAGGFGEIVLGLGQYKTSYIDITALTADYSYP